MKAKAKTNVIKIKIIEANTSQTELAEEFKVSKQTFNGWVTGRIIPSINTGLRLANRLGCKVEELWEYQKEE